MRLTEVETTETNEIGLSFPKLDDEIDSRGAEVLECGEESDWLLVE